MLQIVVFDVELADVHCKKCEVGTWEKEFECNVTVKRRGAEVTIYISLRVRGLTAISQLGEQITRKRGSGERLFTPNRGDTTNVMTNAISLLSLSTSLEQGGGS